ncbi:hypothetical protein [Aeromicrobium sp.]|uniref:hypothetical protein n=1 Tax=Aeromicrobium sp. TaxID=1871063 RepID=UPI0019ABB724|nr:hypothetical protein [Aeromicrobium sp.]MBC7633913.1 hypothetical protein [Aeromicrobium sp.]
MTLSRRPEGTARALLLAAAVTVSAEAVGFVILAVLGLVAPSADPVGVGVGIGVFLLIYGAGQAWAAWRVVRGDAWARSPLIVTQLIQLLLAWNLRKPDERTGDTRLIAALLAVSAVVVLACLLAPPVTRALSEDHRV